MFYNAKFRAHFFAIISLPRKNNFFGSPLKSHVMSRAHQSSQTKNDAYAAGPYDVSLPRTCTATDPVRGGRAPGARSSGDDSFRTRGSHFGPFFIAGFFSHPFVNHQLLNHQLPMKLLTSLILIASALALTTSAQTTNAPGSSPATTSTNAPGSPTPPANFFATVQNYLTSIDTNYTWLSNRVEVAVGADYIAGLAWADYASGQYDLGRWDLETKIRNLGAAGAIESCEAGAGYTVLSDGSVKLQGSVLFGYDFNRSAVLLEPEVVVKKKATANTYLELGLGLPLWLQRNQALNNRPNLFVGAGFTF